MTTQEWIDEYLDDAEDAIDNASLEDVNQKLFDQLMKINKEIEKARDINR